jgi:ribosomal protein S18 acetylase RimI-like enzyme
MSDIQHRNMRRDDIPAVNRILTKSFTKARLDEGYKDTHVPPCHTSFLEMYLAGFPQGCFVVEKNREIVGYSFSRLWGEVGWIGPVSVIPAQQGQKVGQQMMRIVIHTLQSAGARIIGLETIPRNYRNIGFYGKLGFVPQQLVLDMQSPSPEPFDHATSDELEAIFWGLSDQEEKKSLKAALDDFTKKIDPHLSLVREIENIRQFDYGDALLLKDGRRGLIGCAVAHNETYSIEEPRTFLKVISLLLADKRDFRTALEVLHAWAKRDGLSSIVLRAPARYHLAFGELLQCGFRVVHADLRMTLRGHHEVASPESFYLTKWE